MKTMNILKVKTAIKVADIVENTGKSKSHWSISWVVGSDILSNNAGRVYIITSNGIIKKIGGSQSIGGIKNTITSYKGGLGGKPSIRTYGINVLISEEMKSGRNVEIYMIMSETVQAPVKGLFDEELINVAAFKEMENKCREDYKRATGSFPEWNFQESGKKWPSVVNEGFVKLLNKSVK
jgi:hypothetical protein